MVQNLIKFIESRCYMNKVILAGRLVRDPEVRYTQTGKAVASFTLAVNRRGLVAVMLNRQQILFLS